MFVLLFVKKPCKTSPCRAFLRKALRKLRRRLTLKLKIIIY